jgi:RHS repeat-associated protein
MKKLLYLFAFFPLMAIGQTSTENWVKTTKYKTAQMTSLTNPLPIDATVQVSYFDGLGRPTQSVSVMQSGTGTNIVTPITYDSFGRKDKDYLPYVSTSTGQSIEPDAITAVNTFYGSFGETTTNPYTQKFYDPSPLSRVLKHAGVGNDWVGNPSSDADRTVKTVYTGNLASEIHYYTATSSTPPAGDNTYTPSFVDGGTYYTANKLYKTITKDENWTSGSEHTSEEFTDLEGHVVMKRTYGASYVGSTISNQWHETYYVYDQYGNLSYVLPPNVNTATSISAQLDGLCYQYKYDSRNRLVEKKLPGKQWQYIVYDKLDREVATGPAASPFTGPSSYGWLITKYDAMNRPVLTSWTTGTLSSAGRVALQNLYNGDITLNETRKTSGTTTSINGVAFGYTTLARPTAGYHVLTVNYYDDYGFPNAPTTFTNVMADASQPVYYNNTVGTKPKGLPTGHWIRVPQAITVYVGESSYTQYDNKARAVRDLKINYLGGRTQIDNQINFCGQLLRLETKHQRLSTSTDLLTTDSFTFTPQGRPLIHKHKINSGADQLMTKNDYNSIGQLISKHVGGTDAINGTSCLQKMDYSYTIRGWLKAINDVDASGTPPSSITQAADPYDMFKYSIHYSTVDNTAGGNVSKLYNGNISETIWKTYSDNIKRKYGYKYDTMNRMLAGYYQKPSDTSPDTGSYNEQAAYDKSGNIVSMNRWGDYDDAIYTLPIDQLVYTYDITYPNQLVKVADTGGFTSGFKDGTNTGNDYWYDFNGNLTYDANKGISLITYNQMDLPLTITIGSNSITYLYDALGQKIKKTVVDTGVTTTTDYLDGFQYINTALAFFPTSEGYVDVVSGSTPSFNYAFNYLDQLGNVRLTFGLNGGSVVKILEESNYYPFGMKHKNYNVTKLQYDSSGGSIDLNTCVSCKYDYKLNGKEWQDELGLNVYDMDLRGYDPAIGRWSVIDSVDHYSTSPYSAFENNPLFYTDPSGADSMDFLHALWNMSQSGETTYTNDGTDHFYQSSYIPDAIFQAFNAIVANPEEGSSGGSDKSNNKTSIYFQDEPNRLLAQDIAKKYGYTDWRAIQTFLDQNPFVRTHYGVSLLGVEASSSKFIKDPERIEEYVEEKISDKILNVDRVINYFSPTFGKIWGLANDWGGQLLSSTSLQEQELQSNVDQRAREAEDVLIRHFFQKRIEYFNEQPSMQNNFQPYKIHSSVYDLINYRIY